MEMQQAQAAGVGILMVVVLIAFVIMLIPAIFYCLTLQKALNRVSPENRAMAPGMVWLLFIPLFNLVWHFIVVLNVAKSLGAEFKKRNMSVAADPGKGIGLTYCILMCCSIIPIPVVNGLVGLGALVCWIIYWVQIAGFSGKLATPAA
jgi:hypothetical protein